MSRSRSINSKDDFITHDVFIFNTDSKSFIDDCNSESITYKNDHNDLKTYVEDLTLRYDLLLAQYNRIILKMDKNKSSEIVHKLRVSVEESKQNIDNAKSVLDKKYKTKELEIKTVLNIKTESLSKKGRLNSRRLRKGGKRTKKRYTRKSKY